jgi:outer membrane lipoprotein-sorting protein
MQQRRLPPMPPADRRRAIAVALAAVAVTCTTAFAPPGATGASAFDLEALTALLATVRSGEATFVETRRIEMLDRTLTSSGRLTFKAPDVFVRETLKPRHEKLAVDGNTLTMSLGERSRTLQLDASPEAAVIVEAIRGTLTGNRAALERLFETRVGGDAAAWTLELVPRDLRLRGQVASVRVSGRESAVREVRVLLADGDHSVMTIEPVAPGRGAS